MHVGITYVLSIEHMSRTGTVVQAGTQTFFLTESFVKLTTFLSYICQAEKFKNPLPVNHGKIECRTIVSSRRRNEHHMTGGGGGGGVV